MNEINVYFRDSVLSVQTQSHSWREGPLFREPPGRSRVPGSGDEPSLVKQSEMQSFGFDLSEFLVFLCLDGAASACVSAKVLRPNAMYVPHMHHVFTLKLKRTLT